MRLGIDASNIRAGGGVTHLTELIRAVEPRRYGIERIVIWGNRQTLKKLPQRSWLNLAHEPALDSSIPQRVFWQQTKLSQLAKLNCDLLFVPGGRFEGNFRPFVTMSQNLLPFEPDERRRYGLSWTRVRLHLLERSQANTFRQAAGLIFLTETARRVVEHRIGRVHNRVAIIPHGIVNAFRYPPRRQEAISAYSRNRPFKVLYVSIIDVYKHQWQVAEAVASLRQQGLPIMLELVGPAYPIALRRLQEAITRLDPDGEFIRYRGPAPYDELARYYQEADAFVFASSCENLPNILMEAMASGLPIACSERGPMPEVLGDAGVYFDPEQPGQIANTLRRLMEDAALRERCAWSAYQRSQAFSWERCAHETFSLLTDLAQTGRRNVAETCVALSAQ